MEPQGAAPSACCPWPQDDVALGVLSVSLHPGVIKTKLGTVCGREPAAALVCKHVLSSVRGTGQRNVGEILRGVFVVHENNGTRRGDICVVCTGRRGNWSILRQLRNTSSFEGGTKQVVCQAVVHVHIALDRGSDRRRRVDAYP